VRRAGGGVVAVRAEVPALRPVVAGDDVALDPRGVELEGLPHLGRDPPGDPGPQRGAQALVLDLAVAPALGGGVVHAHRPAVPLDHEAALLAAMGLVQGDQAAAELGLQHAGQHQHGRGHLDPGVAVRRRQAAERVQHGRQPVQAAARHHAQQRVQQEGHRRVARGGSGGGGLAAPLLPRRGGGH
jgi:hypothetical protein